MLSRVITHKGNYCNCWHLVFQKRDNAFCGCHNRRVCEKCELLVKSCIHEKWYIENLHLKIQRISYEIYQKIYIIVYFFLSNSLSNTKILIRTTKKLFFFLDLFWPTILRFLVIFKNKFNNI